MNRGCRRGGAAFVCARSSMDQSAEPVPLLRHGKAERSRHNEALNGITFFRPQPYCITARYLAHELFF